MNLRLKETIHVTTPGQAQDAERTFKSDKVLWGGTKSVGEVTGRREPTREQNESALTAILGSREWAVDMVSGRELGRERAAERSAVPRATDGFSPTRSGPETAGRTLAKSDSPSATDSPSTLGPGIA